MLTVREKVSRTFYRSVRIVINSRKAMYYQLRCKGLYLPTSRDAGAYPILP